MNANTSFEIRALAFHRMTGHLAPGAPGAAHSSPAEMEIRQALWTQWLGFHAPIIKALLGAVDEVLRLRDEV